MALSHKGIVRALWAFFDEEWKMVEVNGLEDPAFPANPGRIFQRYF